MLEKYRRNITLATLMDFTLFILLPTLILYEVRTLPGQLATFPVVCSASILLIGCNIFLFSSKEQKNGNNINIRAIAVFISVLVIFSLLLDIIGFYASAIILAFFSYLHFEPDRSKKNIFYAALTAVIIVLLVHICFALGLNLALPEGLLFAW